MKQVILKNIIIFHESCSQFYYIKNMHTFISLERIEI